MNVVCIANAARKASDALKLIAKSAPGKRSADGLRAAGNAARESSKVESIDEDMVEPSRYPPFS
jgi:hypothetical protein